MDPSLPVPAPRLLEVYEVAFQLKCSPETVRRLIRAGALIAVGLTMRSYRIEPDDLRAFIAARKKRGGHWVGHRPRDEANPS